MNNTCIRSYIFVLLQTSELTEATLILNNDTILENNELYNAEWDPVSNESCLTNIENKIIHEEVITKKRKIDTDISFTTKQNRMKLQKIVKLQHPNLLMNRTLLFYLCTNLL